MASYGMKKATRSKNPRNKRPLVHTKKNQVVVTANFSHSSNSTTSDLFGEEFEGADHDMTAGSGCSTPKAKRYQIPKIATCPPAPNKKRRLCPSSTSSTSCSLLQRPPIAFFAPPDLELFFFFAMRDVSV